MRQVEKDLLIDDSDAKAVREARAAWSAALGRTRAAFTARSAMGDSVTSVQRVQASIETLSAAAAERVNDQAHRLHAVVSRFQVRPA